MLIFILLSVLIVITCLAIMLRPLFKAQKLKTQQKSALDRDTQNIIFAKSRLVELQAQLASQEIKQDDFNALKLEIETSLLRDIDLKSKTSEESIPPESESNGVVIALLCTLIPFAALGIYQITGTPAALNADNLSTPQTLFEGQNLDQMVAGVEQRLQQNPNDLQGWTILAQSYLALERYQDALNANQKILELAGESAAVYTQLADSSALLAGGNLNGEPNEYIEKALAIDPQYPQALWLAGLSAAQTGDTKQAQTYWTTLLPLLSNSPQQQQELREIIAQTSASLDLSASENLVQSTVPMTSQSTIQETAANDKVTTATAQPGIRVQVSLDEKLLLQVQATDTVFIFARAQNGPPAPLAVKRLTVADLPITVSLSDSDAMMAQFKLSLFEDIVVNARISKSGDPIAQTGDIQSIETNSKNTNTNTIELIISELVP